MEISNVQHQAMASNNPLIEQVLGCSKAAQHQHQQQQQEERRSRPHPADQSVKCPRCDSSNTKFCYYNNYSLSQPRYFCKGCRRYWTQGGSLRNVPVGGGCRKNKRSSSSSSTSSKRQQDLDQPLLIPNPTMNPLLTSNIVNPPSSIPYEYDPNDLSLTFAPTTRQLGLFSEHDTFLLGNPNPNPNPNLSQMAGGAPTPGFLDILRSGLLDSTGPNGFHNLYCGFVGAGNGGGDGEAAGWGEEVVMPFEGGLAMATRGGTTTTTTTTNTSSSTVTATTTSQGSSSAAAMDGGENKVVVGLQWHSGGEGSMGLDPAGRDYWNGVGSSSSWHGLINSSLM